MSQAARPEGGSRSDAAAPAVISPAGWPRGAGYAHGTAARGRVVFTAGQIGWDPVTRRLVGRDFAAQAAQALANVVAVITAAGAEPRHVTRMTWFVTDREAYLAAARATGEAYRSMFGGHYPAMAVVVVSALLEEDALVEIEATAVIPD